MCRKFYKRAGIIEMVRTYEDWERTITCCGQKSMEYARTIQQSTRDLPYIDDGRTKRVAVKGVMVDGKCFTGRRGPN